MLVYDDIVTLRLELSDDVCAPSVADENSILSTIRGLDRLSHVKPLQVQHPILRIGCSQVRKVGPITHLQIYDSDPDASGRSEYPGCRANSPLNTGNVNSRSVKHPTLGSKIVLHVDDDNCCLRWVNRSRFWLSVERQYVAHDSFP